MLLASPLFSPIFDVGSSPGLTRPRLGRLAFFADGDNALLTRVFLKLLGSDALGILAGTTAIPALRLAFGDWLRLNLRNTRFFRRLWSRVVAIRMSFARSGTGRHILLVRELQVEIFVITEVRGYGVRSSRAALMSAHA
jgi:hypothetical protein